jgi:uncharacterized protein YigE (DUF2233 family)
MKILWYQYWLLGIVLLMPCCWAHNKTKEENTKLNKEVQELKNSASQKQKKHTAEIAKIQAERDSLSRQVAVMKNTTVESCLAKIDSLEKEIVHRQNLLAASHIKNQQQDETLQQMQLHLRTFYAVPGNEAQRVPHKRNDYDCYSVDLKKCELQFFWKEDKTQQPLRSLRNVARMVETDKTKMLVFGMNAGMYTQASAPQGLFVQNGKALVKIDRKKEEFGNFYMQPNGIFLVDTAGAAKILTTEQYTDDMVSRVRFATQSGPMLVVNGEINSKFKIGSDNLNIRNGVGILPDGRPVFVISNQRISLYDFAAVFKDKFKCSNALYLDGAISQMFLPELGRFEDGGSFGPIIGVIKK